MSAALGADRMIEFPAEIAKWTRVAIDAGMPPAGK